MVCIGLVSVSCPVRTTSIPDVRYSCTAVKLTLPDNPVWKAAPSCRKGA